MSELRYETPKTAQEAVMMMTASHGVGKILAGGTDLLIQMRSGRVRPGTIIDVKHIPEMTTIVAEGGGF